MNEALYVNELIRKLTYPSRYTKKDDLIGRGMDISTLEKEFFKRLNNVRSDAAAELVKIGAPAVEALVEQLESQELLVRVYSASILGAIGDVRAVDALIKALNDKDKNVRSSAAEALGKIGDTRAVDPLKSLLEDGEFEVRKAAADAIGKITGTRPKVKGACFIATATMGSYDHPTVLLFRIFRDEFLYKRIWGKHFINQYYRYSPPVAQLIENNLLMKKICYWIILKPCEVIIRTLWAEGHSPWKG